MKALPAVLLFVLLLPPCLFGQSGKPQTIIVPTGSLGDISKTRITILEKTLESKLDDYFDLVPKDLFEEAQEQAFQEMELEECTEEQCIMMIREILQVENSFQLVLMVDGGDTQISLTWNDLDKKRVEEEYCEGCKTKELRESVGGLVERLIKAGNAADVSGLSKTKTAQQQPAALRQKQKSAGEWTESNTGMKFRRIPGGSFRMGSPSWEEGRKDHEKQHTVRVGEFWLAETEVTLGQFSQFVRDSGHRPQSESKGCWWYTESKWEESKSKNWRSPGFSQLDSQPVVCVSWNDASAYAKWLSRKTGKRFRLPTEAEWEYAARAGTQTARYWGEAIGRNNANCGRCGSRWDGKQTAPVGSFSPNAFGLHDMLGNVWEWMCSEYKESYDGSEQKCSVSARRYSLRGGSWLDGPGGVRAAYRFGGGFPDVRYSGIGFRLARD